LSCGQASAVRAGRKRFRNAMPRSFDVSGRTRPPASTRFTPAFTPRTMAGTPSGTCAAHPLESIVVGRRNGQWRVDQQARTSGATCCPASSRSSIAAIQGPTTPRRGSRRASQLRGEIVVAGRSARGRIVSDGPRRDHRRTVHCCAQRHGGVQSAPPHWAAETVRKLNSRAEFAHGDYRL